jgi:histidinol-phosphate aminotransferase
MTNPVVADSSPLLSRRHALLGAAALLSPLAPHFAIGAGTAIAPPKAVQTGPAAGLIRLDSNENPYGPSPAAREAIIASAGEAPRYADAAIDQLGELLAKHQQVAASQVVIGSGSSELLHISALLAAEGGPGSNIVAADPTFEDLLDFGGKFGVQARWVPGDVDHRHDLSAMKAAITPDTRMVYVCNPNNPTGTAHTRATLEPFLRSLPPTVLVVVDEAYIDFVDAPGVSTMIPLVRELPNLIVLRTFSKIHGLAGLRVGYAVATPALAARMTNKQLAFSNITGLRAAMASLGDTRFLTETRAAVLADRNRLHEFIDRGGLRRAASQGNFVFFDTGRPLADFAKDMLAANIKVGRHFNHYDSWARITIGTHAEVDRLLAALPAALTRA